MERITYKHAQIVGCNPLFTKFPGKHDASCCGYRIQGEMEDRRSIASYNVTFGECQTTEINCEKSINLLTKAGRE